MSMLVDEIKRSMGSTEKMIRISLGLILVGLGLFYFGGRVGVKLGVAIALLGILPLLTGILNFCPLYSIWGLKSKKTSK